MKRDDPCVVRSERGVEYGTCVTSPELCSEEMERKLRDTVLRKASPSDETTQRQIRYDEERAKEFCAARISERSLPMKLVDVEYTFDRHKIVFYFTSEERVDFRQLVRDLAQELRARIELRQIQVRDEAKLTGGLGVCGRCLCCATWMTEFKPISMKMAKRQNLSLNPSKISGQCGRLLCCLSYENGDYADQKKVAKAAAMAAVAVSDEAEPLDDGLVEEPEWEKRLEEADRTEGISPEEIDVEEIENGEAEESLVSVPADHGDAEGVASAGSEIAGAETRPAGRGEGQTPSRRRRGRRKRRGTKRPSGGGNPPS